MRQDWHPADIIAGLRKRGTSLAALSRRSGLSSATLANALTRPWPKGEYLIAEELGVHPSMIWPSRYYRDGAMVERKALMRGKRGEADLMALRGAFQSDRVCLQTFSLYYRV